MRPLYAGAAFDVALIIVLLVTGNVAFAVICIVLLVPTLDYIRRQR